MADIVIGHGFKLQRGDGGSPEVFTTITEVLNVSISLSRDAVEKTNMDSANKWREYIYGLKDGGEVPFDFNYDPADTTADATTGLLSMFAATAAENFKIIMPNAASTTWSFSALLVGFNANFSTEDKITVSGSLKITGEPTLA